MYVVCMFVYAYMHIFARYRSSCVGVCAYVCVGGLGLRLMSEITLSYSSPLFIDAGSFNQAPKFINMATFAG